MNASVKGAKPDPGAGDARRDRWSAHREQRRGEFIAAALRVLAAQGPDVTMDAVAAEAGVTKPVLYRYFSDKTALVTALGEFGSNALLDRLLPAIAADLPALTRIRGTITAYFESVDELPNLYWLIVRHTAGEIPAENDPYQRNKDLIATALTALFGDYLRAYGLDSGAAEPWAYGITGLVQATVEWWLQRRSMSRVHAIEYTTQLIYAALAGVLPAGALDEELELGRSRFARRPPDESPEGPRSAPPSLKLVSGDS
ncbi:TetR/AcrR family transcriptional regulator [Actinospica sp.]|uniref:TetR/AcrR family transcriptional regulator n=1 Tax=Actinospica sp. TaxID=1872142 RepID=UPI002CDFB01C|nr:TetR/AcrR family transcriptional regulator [Actinospica sp.]HWG25144.1 TetR/AcrR family transcriptional regulator [Actinospica sp.]